MTDNTARKKVPLPPGYVVPRPQQPPPLRRRDNSSTTGVELASPAPPTAAASAPVPVAAPKAPISEQHDRVAAFREAMDTLADDEDKTTAFQVPEELLRRSRTGMPGSVLDDEERAPDSGAITAPPPAAPEAEASELKLGVPGLPKNLDVGSFADEGLEETGNPGDTLGAEDEHSGEFTRINKAGELEMLLPTLDKQELTHTSVRKRQLQIQQQPPKTSTAAAVLWVVIGTLSAAGAILASLVANG